MTQPHIAQRAPYAIAVVAGRKYAWCACGRSASQPFCDGSHKETGASPLVIVAERSETVYFCGCKHTRTAPWCDGSHETL
jgi:CDGSH-type Zn-finger protein